MAEGQVPDGIVDLSTHIHDTFEFAVLQANAIKKGWALAFEGTPFPYASGSDVSIPIEDALTVDTSELADKVDGAPLATGDAAILLPNRRYGHYVLITEGAVEEKDMNTIDAKTKALAEQAVAKKDLLAGTAMIGGANVQFKNGRVDEDALLAGDVMEAVDFVSSLATLEDADATPFDNGMFKAFLSSFSIADLYDDGAVAKGFLERIGVTGAADDVNLRAFVGSFHGFDVFRVKQLTVDVLGADTAQADLVKAVFCGREYLGYTQAYDIRFSGFKPAGDLMEQQMKMLWKGRFGYGRIKEQNGLRFEARSAFTANP